MQHYRAIVVFGTLVLGACGLGGWYAIDAMDGGGLSDAQTVYCLDPAHAPAVARAGAELGLVASASGSSVNLSDAVLSLPAWRARDEADFDRACLAVAQPAIGGASSGSGDVGPTLIAMLQVAFGALLTLAVGTRQDIRNSRKDDVAALREQWTDFNAALREYVDSRSGDPSTRIDRSPMTSVWVSLHGRVESIAGAHASWKEATDIQTLLDHELSPDQVAQWPDGPNGWEARQHRRTELLTHAATGAARVERLAGRIKNPLRHAWSG